MAQQKLIRLKINYAPDHPAYQSAEGVVKNLDDKIDDRMDGIMLGLEARAAFRKSYLETLKADMEEARKANQSAQ